MKFKAILAGTAIATLALVSDAGAPLGLQFTPRAEAAVNISFSLFYDELADHGDWVRYNDRYVFIPANVGDDWRPYTLGHWVYTKRYGWTWVSDEEFGWATYHYGRWGYAEDIGWYWVPGKRWAPAWVSWRRSNDYIVWAPLPPSSRGDVDVDVSISISVGDIPDYYWVAVPAQRFLSTDIHVVIVRDEPEIRRVIERTEFVGAPRITNNIVVNNVIDVDVVAQATGQEVKAVEVKETSDPAKAKSTANEVTVFEGEVAPDENAKPKQVREVSEVKKVKRAGEKAGGATQSQPVPEPDAGTAAETGTATEAPAEGAVETPPAAADQAQPETPAKPAKKPKAEEKPAKAAEQPAAPAEEPAPAAEEQPAQQAQPEQAQPEPAQPEQKPADAGPAQEEPSAKANKGKGKKDCDPATDADCPAE